MALRPFHFQEQPASRFVSAGFEGASHMPVFKGAAACMERLPPG
jgi:hypothetical protein